ncbi:MAG: hypothetical protein JNK87_31385 [Bryobacterales bacterium]|nr:hypothetical protein [Bryobacterales bacterium]
MRLLAPFFCLLLTANAALQTVQVIERSDVDQAKAYGGAGAYEQIWAKAYFLLDPKAPSSARISDIDKAPRNDKGQVAFSADIFVMKPRDPSKGNGTVLFEVSNRGGRAQTGMFGAPFLMEQGYTLAWVGWQFDVNDRPQVIKLHAPKAQGVTGLVRSDYQAKPGDSQFSVAADGHEPYAAAALDQPDARMTVREWSDGPRTIVPRANWRFVDATTVAVDGMQPGKTYEVVYTAKDPGISGLGQAAIRDFISFLKFGNTHPTALLGEQKRWIKRAIGYGSSQSGRFLRDFLYNGFNADEQGRIVFEGLIPHIAGAARGGFSHRFAQPSRTAPYYNIDVFPFRDLDDTDPITGWRDSILARAQASNTIPKIFYTLTSTEYWARSASLMHTTIDGKADAPLAPNTRIYHFSSTQHGAGNWPTRKSKEMQYALNPHDYKPFMRALLVAMQEWLLAGKEPPASRYASVAQLAPFEKLRWPKGNGFVPPVHVRQAMRLDYGPEFRDKGIITNEPPKAVGKPYAVKLPQLDEDGNELGGLKLPSVAVPLGAAFGWNVPARELGWPMESIGTPGSWIPFPADKIKARYGSKEAYLAKVRAAADQLVAARYLLAGDVDALIARSASQWDDLTK